MKQCALLSLLVMGLVCVHGAPLEQVGVKPGSCQDAQALNAAGLALTEINKDRQEGFVLSLYRLANVNQMKHGETGVVFYLTLDVEETNCHVLSRKDWKNCEVRTSDQVPVYGQCKASIFISKVHRVVRLYKYNCMIRPVPAEKVVEVCPDCPSHIAKDNTEIVKTVTLSLEKFNKESALSKRFALLNITRATSSIGGMASFYNVEYTVQETTCTKSADSTKADQCPLMECEFSHKGHCKGSHSHHPGGEDVSVECEIYEPEAAEKEKKLHLLGGETDHSHAESHTEGVDQTHDAAHDATQGHPHDHVHDHTKSHQQHSAQGENADHHHTHDHAEGSHDHSHDHGHGEGHDHSHDHVHDHSHDHGHNHTHDHNHAEGSHDHSLDHGHGEGHNHAHDHDHAEGSHDHSLDHGHGEGHNHNHTHDHDHAEGSHDHSLDHGHGEGHNHTHDHDHAEGSHDHSLDHGHGDGHDHSHDHVHDHSHDHGHNHTHDHDHAEGSHDHSHDHGHGEGHDHSHDHVHGEGHDHSHDHVHREGHDHSHDHGHGHDHVHAHHAKAHDHSGDFPNQHHKYHTDTDTHTHEHDHEQALDHDHKHAHLHEHEHHHHHHEHKHEPHHHPEGMVRVLPALGQPMNLPSFPDQPAAGPEVGVTLPLIPDPQIPGEREPTILPFPSSVSADCPAAAPTREGVDLVAKLFAEDPMFKVQAAA